MKASENPIPFSVIGGFLGAGKTTLLNRLLRATSGVRFAVLVNDFGDLAIDGDLVSEHGGDTITFANGCLCCTMGDDMLLTLNELLHRTDLPEHIIVEASGIADPRPIADIASLHPGLVREPVVVLVDAETIIDRAADQRLRDTVVHQLEAAEIIVLNKCDLITEDRRLRVRDWLTQQVLYAAIVETDHARLPPEFLTPLSAQQRREAPGESGKSPSTKLPKHDHDQAHDHNAQFRSVFLAFDRAVDLDTLRTDLLNLPASVLRAKGFLRPIGDSAQVHVIQLAGRRLHIERWATGASPQAEPAMGLVLVGTPDMPDAASLRRSFRSLAG